MQFAARLNRLRKKSGVSQWLTSAAKAVIEKRTVTARLKPSPFKSELTLSFFAASEVVAFPCIRKTTCADHNHYYVGFEKALSSI